MSQVKTQSQLIAKAAQALNEKDTDILYGLADNLEEWLITEEEKHALHEMLDAMIGILERG
jgi:hypothetical protein